MTENEPDENSIDYGRLKRDRILFYTGIILILAGGPGLALGSWMHDVYRIPIIGVVFWVFGWVNVVFLIVGLVILFVGVLLVVISLRGGVISGMADQGVENDSR